jgi:hypothetical protein
LFKRAAVLLISRMPPKNVNLSRLRSWRQALRWNCRHDDRPRVAKERDCPWRRLWRRLPHVRREAGPDCAKRYLTPGDVNSEEDSGVGQQGEGQPLQEVDVTMIGYEWRETGLDVGGKSFSGDSADFSAHGLDRRHQRESQRHRPQHVETELRPRLRVSGYATRVVVSHAGDEPRPDPCKGGAPSDGPRDTERC